MLLFFLLSFFLCKRGISTFFIKGRERGKDKLAVALEGCGEWGQGGRKWERKWERKGKQVVLSWKEGKNAKGKEREWI